MVTRKRSLGQKRLDIHREGLTDPILGSQHLHREVGHRGRSQCYLLPHCGQGPQSLPLSFFFPVGEVDHPVPNLEYNLPSWAGLRPIFSLWISDFTSGRGTKYSPVARGVCTVGTWRSLWALGSQSCIDRPPWCGSCQPSRRLNLSPCNRAALQPPPQSHDNFGRLFCILNDLGVLEKAQLVNCLPCKRENLSQDSHYTCKKPDVSASVSSPGLGRQKQRDS